MTTRYDAASRGEPERFVLWHNVICELFPRAACQRATDGSFVASLEQYSLGNCKLAEVSSDAVRYDRVLADQRADGMDEFMVSLMLEGDAVLEQGNRSTRQRPGQIAIYDAAQPFRYHFATRYRLLLATVPRRSLLSRLANVERLTAMGLDTVSSPAGGLAANVMTTAAKMGSNASQKSMCYIGWALVDVLTAAIGELGGVSEEPADRRKQMVRRAKEYARQRIDDSELDLDAIANALHVSARTLSRAFACEGDTVMRWLWKERLDLSRQILAEGHADYVAQVALGCGFSNNAHFSRIFKEAFGMNPNSLLRAHP